MSSPFSAGVRLPPSHLPPQELAPPPAPSPPAAAVAAAEPLTGRVLGKFNKEPLCTLHFPAAPELTRLAHGAGPGRPAPFVGTGDPYTALSCACLAESGQPPWRLGDQVVHISRACLAGQHDRCLDKACQCECQGSDAAKAIAAAADNSLADALRQISAAFVQVPPPELAEALKVIVDLQAKVKALEAGAPAKAPAKRPARPPAVRTPPGKAAAS